jgi:UDP-N-acetyl-D-mannosaminuronic acid dehydrogenase
MFRPDELGQVQFPKNANNGKAWYFNGSLAIVGGCGHVGLPLGMAFARKGVRVDLIDTCPERVAMVMSELMPFKEDGADELLPELIQSGLLRATTNSAVLEEAAAVIITIGTPVGDFCEPSIGEFDRAMDRILVRLRPGQLVALRSTVFPGVTERLARRMKDLGLEDVELAFCPERIVQDKSLVELETLPQMIGGVTPRAAKMAAELFGLLAPKIIFVKPVEAELAKLFCNAYRYINFAIANQFYLIAERHEADFHRLYQAMREDYPRIQGLARPGLAAGPCLVKDTCQLGAFNHGSFPLGQAAIEVNEGLPALLVDNIKRAYNLKNMTVGVLGMAFKANNDDHRDSLSYKLRKVLLLECREVLCTDPYISDKRFLPLAEVIDRADLLIVATPHDCYRGVDFSQPVIDITGTVSRQPLVKITPPSVYRGPHGRKAHVHKASVQTPN